MADEYKTVIPCLVSGPTGSITTQLELTLTADSMAEAMSVIQSWFNGCSKPVVAKLVGIEIPPGEPDV
jgi:hypothetical protein